MKDYLVSIDRDENPVMLVLVTTEPATTDDVLDLVGHLRATNPPVPFGMIVDPEVIAVIKAHGDDHRPHLAELSTRDVLGHYSPNFMGDDTNYGTKSAFLSYMQTLTGSWLRDLAHHWKSDSPPGMRDLAEAGLLDRLVKGFTHDEVSIYGQPVR
jgi:hypothetical protein